MIEYSLWTSILCKISFSALASTMFHYWIRLSFTTSLASSVEISKSSAVSGEGLGSLLQQNFQNNDGTYKEKVKGNALKLIESLILFNIGFFGILVSNLSLTLF